jgi:L-alanine-DL-glutamate epimerase-like enolase superfamily enzyme
VVNWALEEKILPLKYNWKLSRNETFEKVNFIVKVSKDNFFGMGEVAPNVRYGESLELIKSQFLILKEFLQEVNSPAELEVLLNNQSVCNSLRFGIDSAFIHYFCGRKNLSVSSYFQLPTPNKIATCYTIPIIAPGEVKHFIETNQLDRFATLKIKVNSEGYDLINEVQKYYKKPLKIDANEAWREPESFLRFMEKLKNFNIDFLEQPFPSNAVEEYIYLKKNTTYPIVADESVTSDFSFEELDRQFHGINMKLMKAGSYKKGIDILKEARAKKMITMIGCMVETSLGISSALNIAGLSDYADLDGFMIIKDDPFDLVKEKEGYLTLAE